MNTRTLCVMPERKQFKRGSIQPDKHFWGLVPTNVDWLSDQKEKELVMKRFNSDREIEILPILMCPDDCDLWSTVIVAEVVTCTKYVMWRRIGGFIMNKMIEYGFLCTSKDEKALMNALYKFLEPLNRTFSKTNNKGMLTARLPYVYKYFYWNLNKEKQVYVEMYPNKDLEGKCKFSNEDVGWGLFANLKDQAPPYHVPFEEQEKYLNDLLSSSNFDYVKLYEYSDGEERL